MHINRTFLYAGVFLIVIGGVWLAADWAIVDTPALTGLLRLWPLVFVAIGAGLVLRRTQWGLAAGLAAVAVPALFIGSALAAAPRLSSNCGAAIVPDAGLVETRTGSFDGPANVAIRAGCGNLNLTTAPGSAWQLQASNGAGQVTAVESTAQSLSVGDLDEHGWQFFDAGRDSWSLSLPTSQITELSIRAVANASHISLAGAQVGRLALEADLSEMRVDASQASIGQLSADVDLGSLSIQLPAASLSGELKAGGGELQVCSPPGVGLHISTRGSAEEITIAGLRQTGSEWQSADYLTASQRIDLSIRANLSSVEINPIGGCR